MDATPGSLRQAAPCPRAGLADPVPDMLAKEVAIALLDLGVSRRCGGDLGICFSFLPSQLTAVSPVGQKVMLRL